MATAKVKIIKAASDLFEKNGFNGVTTKEIAAKAGVSEVTVFRNFETKRALFTSILKQKTHPYKVQKYLTESATYNLETDVKAMADMLMDTLEKNLPLMRMLVKDHHSKGAQKRVKVHDSAMKERTLDYFNKMHDMGKLSVSPKMAARFLLSNISGAMANAMFNADEPIDKEYFHWMIEKVIDVIKAK